MGATTNQRNDLVVNHLGVTGKVAVDGTLAVDGVLTAAGGVVGASAGVHTGAVVGNVTGNLAGNVTGEINGAHLDSNATGVGFYGATPAAKQAGVAVTAEAIHAALVALGLIAA